jgi:hypothetical protein
MQIRLLVSRAGSDFAQNAGDVIEVDADEAGRMIDAGQAELIREEAVERAVNAQSREKAVK